MVVGTVASQDGGRVGGLRVQVVDKDVGSDVLLAETVTDTQGRYQVCFDAPVLRDRRKTLLDLQARILSGQTFLAASGIRYNAGVRETLDILLPLLPLNTTALPSEYETLMATIAAQFSGRLGDLQESDDRQDITYLANKTGWDARAVALAALADQFSRRTGEAGIAPAFFYALFRAGLPANEDTLYRIDASTLKSVWEQAVSQGVIPQSLIGAIPTAIAQFQTLTAQKLLTGPALTGPSTLKEMLTISGLSAEQHARFAEIYSANRSDTPTFWKAVGEAFGPSVLNRLQLDGKLGFLTINNALLIQRLHRMGKEGALSDPVELAQNGYHNPQNWSGLLTSDVPIPKEIPGDTPDAQRANYANYLAVQVRLSYPTAAVAQMVKSGELLLTRAANGVSDQVHTFLSEHQGRFEIGVEPVEQYIARNKVQAPSETIQQVKRLQRVYQITPSDQAMSGLMKRGIDAAYHVVRYDRDTFVQSFSADLGGADQAKLTYNRSVQIHNVVLNIALGYLHARTAPAIGVHSPANVIDPAPANAGDVIAYPTLESLFGSMDFCACDHCRSILSPAAYLVDLLQFLGSDETVWAEFISTWKAPQGGHEGAPYPFPNQAAFTKAGSPSNTEISPFEVLISRRPDIQYLPLTCENTNTALPYIDLVNETLEYYIANNSQKLSLADYRGNDTNGSASEDLLASPQFVIDAAYDTLREELFPGPLPFHQPLENMRRYFNKLEVPLATAMERLRKSDDLERGANSYGWRDILIEETGLSRAEHEILTDSNAVPLWRMYGFDSGTADSDVIAGLSNAKQFARRVGITSIELISILRSRFINPNSFLIPKLERLGVPFSTLKALKDGTITDSDFDDRLAALALLPDPAEYGGEHGGDIKAIKAWVRDADNYGRIMGLITLAVPLTTWAAAKAYSVGDCVVPSAPQPGSTLYYECAKATSAAIEPTWPTSPGDTIKDGTAVVWTCRDTASCQSFDNLAFRYSDPAKLTQNIGSAEFVRLARFIRLWKKLGWTIAQTDAAICAFYRADLVPVSADDISGVVKLDTGFLTLLPRIGIVIRVMRALHLTVKRDLLSLLACFGSIDVSDGAEWVRDNEGGLRLQTIPSLYRQLLLNPAILKQDVTFADNGYGEFLTDAMKKLADHSESLRSAFNLTDDEYDRIFAALRYDSNTPLNIPNLSAIYRHGWFARKLKLSVRELLLLIQFTGLDPFAAPSPTNPAMMRLLELVQAMKARSFKPTTALYLIWNQDLSGKSAPAPAQIAELGRTLRGDFATIDNQFAASEDPSGDVARGRMALVYGEETSDAFFALLDDTLVVDAAFTQKASALDPDIVAGDPAIAYDDFRHRLSHRGLLTAATQTTLKSISGISVDFQKAVDALFARSEEIKGLFFTAHPELKAAYDSAVVVPLADRHKAFLAVFEPELSRRRKRQQALQRISASVGVDLVFTQNILDPPGGPYPLHAARDRSKAALDDVVAIEKAGLSAQFFFRDTATGNIDYGVPIVASFDYASESSNSLPNPGNPVSGIWSGQIETPEAGFYNFVIEADSEATVTLTLDGQAIALTQNGNIRRNTDAIELKAGTLYEIQIKVEKVKDLLVLKWETPKRPREVVPSRYLYPPFIIEPFSSAYVRFLKAASLATGLGLTANELAYFATHSDYQITADGWLNALSASGDSPAAIAPALVKPFEALIDFSRIKTEVSPTDESLLTVLQDPTTAAQTSDNFLFAITHWNSASLNDIVAQFSGTIASLGHFDLFRRVYDALALTRNMGISAKALIQAATNEPTPETVRNLQAALRARYDPDDWRDVIRPINDEMRGLQRDALVAYILHQMGLHPGLHPESAHVDTPDKLFEYFLMDVQMDPCMQTSRIRNVLSSVQLFIERCFLNLEPRVSSSAINAKQWEWMRRYRVWEANRKVYLFPENWLEPELRDDQSPIFKETMSELLQSDITEDRAEVALLNYLSKLGDVAKLEPCGVYHVEGDSMKRIGGVDHVIARTPGAHRKYYYRRYEEGYWTPWEQVSLDIEDNPVVHVVWNDRLLLFWLRLLKEPPLRPPAKVPPPTIQKSKDPNVPDATDPNERVGNLTGKQLSVSMVSTVQTDVAQQSPEEALYINIKAVLCWSEYYGGKWQTTKTSEVDRPTLVKRGEFGDANSSGFPPSGQYAFDRSKLRLGVAPEGKALRIGIYDVSSYWNAWSSFLLYNTHSAPVREEDNPMDHRLGDYVGNFRNLIVDPNKAAFTIAYNDDPEHDFGDAPTYDVLRMQDPNDCHTAEPLQSLDDWNAPFFFWDSRNLFYVTSTPGTATIAQQNGYVIPFLPAPQKYAIPPMVFKGDPAFSPASWSGLGDAPAPGIGFTDSLPAKRFVTQDAYIHTAIAANASVSYGTQKIGTAGALRSGLAGS
jgi:hypothetical protein